jgi:hypothetical protein
MPEPFVASVQYGDFKGTIAIDGHDSDFLDELAAQAVDMPKGYWPVGFELWNPYELDEDGAIPLTIVAADCSQVGESVEEMRRYHEGRVNGSDPFTRPTFTRPAQPTPKGPHPHEQTALRRSGAKSKPPTRKSTAWSTVYTD